MVGGGGGGGEEDAYMYICKYIPVLFRDGFSWSFVELEN